MEERPDEVTDLHRRAGQWYGAAGEPVSAVRHALAAGDVEHAADLVEVAIPVLLRDRQEATVRRWLDDIPPEVVRVRPVLGVGFIGALMSGGEFEGVESRLDDVERLLAAAAGQGSATTLVEMVAVEEVEFSRLPGTMETYRAALALVRGDPSATVVHADRAIACAADGDDRTVAAASALSGLASWGSGDLEAAHRGYSAAVDGLRRAGHLSDVLGCSITLADIRTTQGHLSDALRTYQDALQLAAAVEVGAVMRGTADMLVGLSQIAFERNDFPGASAYLTRAEELGEHTGLPQHPYRWRVARARLCEAEGDLVRALHLLEEAQRVYVGDFSPNVRPIPALRARLLLAQGRRALRAGLAYGVRAPRSSPGGRRGGRENRHPHRDPDPEGTRAPRRARPPRPWCPRPAGTGAEAGRIGGICARLRRRKRPDGHHARRRHQQAPRLVLPASPPRRL